ncbi:hypothetical protein PRZ48_000061 [Zasmidium cellare]|uniref:Uncharacterized protein n=1 Tax=Zasmidium cellare TaxID=395010 RepID=A0ABR0EZ10_ZASCE|nr:hypothetical protein PRZ48_000061 [Zasmidium cellare]
MSRYGAYGNWGKKEPTKEKADQMSQPWRRGSASTAVESQEDRQRRDNIANQTRSNPIKETEAPSTPVPEQPKPEASPKVDEQGFEKVRKKSTKGITGEKASAALSHVPHPPANIDTFVSTQAPIRRGSGLAPSDKKTKEHGVFWSEQVPGIIVRHYHYCRVKDPNMRLDDPGVYRGGDGALWHRKWRYYLIIRRWGETVAEIPIYTYGDRGLAMKPKNIHCEFLSIKPFRVLSTDFVNQSPDNPVLSVEKQFGRLKLDRLTMVARFTEIQTRSLDCDELVVVGKLDEKSTQVMVECAYGKSAEIAWKPST